MPPTGDAGLPPLVDPERRLGWTVWAAEVLDDCRDPAGTERATQTES